MRCGHAPLSAALAPLASAACLPRASLLPQAAYGQALPTGSRQFSNLFSETHTIALHDPAETSPVTSAHSDGQTQPPTSHQPSLWKTPVPGPRGLGWGPAQPCPPPQSILIQPGGRTAVGGRALMLEPTLWARYPDPPRGPEFTSGHARARTPHALPPPFCSLLSARSLTLAASTLPELSSPPTSRDQGSQGTLHPWTSAPSTGPRAVLSGVRSPSTWTGRFPASGLCRPPPGAELGHSGQAS